MARSHYPQFQIAAIIALLVALPATVLVLQLPQQLRQHAATSVTPPAITGTVYYDTNRNGEFDVGESPVSGQLVALSTTGGTLVNSTTTGTDGTYAFNNLAINAYKVSVGFLNDNNPPCTVSTNPVITQVSSGQTVTTSFGLCPPQATNTPVPNSIQGSVFIDANRNGIWDQGETVVSNITLQLLTGDAARNILSTTTSDSNGSYQFTSLPSAVYEVRAVYNNTNNAIPVTQGANPFTVVIASGGSATVIFPLSSTYLSPTPTSVFAVPTSSPTPVPTSTPFPTATTVPQGTQLAMTLFLHGIGESGDNPNPANFSTSNHTPEHPQRVATVELFDNTDTAVATATGTLVYQPTTGNFLANVDMGPDILTGNYSVKVTTPRYLRRTVSPLVHITSGQETTITGSTEQTTNTLIAGDIDGNNKVTVLDYSVLLDCGYGDLTPLPITDPTSTFHSANCQSHTNHDYADLNDDGQIDHTDYNLFLRELAVQTGD